MTPREAREIADEHIAWWKARGTSSRDAYSALQNGKPVWTAEWWEVEARMVEWLLKYGRE